MAAELGFIGKAVALVVMVIMVATVVIPIVDDARDTITVTDANAGELFRLSVRDTDINLSITAVDVSAKQYVVDGENVTVESVTKYRYVTDVCNINLYNGTMAGLTASAVNFADGDTIVITNGSLVYTPADPEDSEVTGTVSMMFAYDPTNGTYGDYYYTSYNGSLKINNKAKVYALANITASTPNLIVEFDRTGNCEIVGQYGHSGYFESTASVSLTSSDFNKYAWQLDTFTLSTTVISSQTTTTSESFDIYVPVEYTVIDVDSSNYSLLGIIPLMLIIVCVLFAVGMMRGRS